MVNSISKGRESGTNQANVGRPEIVFAIYLREARTVKGISPPSHTPPLLPPTVDDEGGGDDGGTEGGTYSASATGVVTSATLRTQLATNLMLMRLFTNHCKGTIIVLVEQTLIPIRLYKEEPINSMYTPANLMDQLRQIYGIVVSRSLHKIT